MSTTASFPHINKAVSLLAFCPEVVQGTPNYSCTADGGANSGTAITIDTTTGATQNDNLAAVTANKFQGLMVYFLPNTATAALRGKAYPISASSAPAANIVTLTVATMAATPAGTDTFYILGPLPADSVSISAETEDLPRDFARLTLDAPSAVKGLTKASGSFGLELPGLVTTLGNGATPALDRWSQLLELLGTRRAVAGTTVSGGGSSTTVVDVTSAASFAVGDLVMIGGEVRRITAINTAATPDNITITPALSAAPADTTVVYQSETITPYDTGHGTATLLWIEDDRLVVVQGAVLNFKMAAQFGQKLAGSVEFDGEWATSQWSDGSTLGGYQADKSPIPFVAGEIHFGTTKLNVNNFEFDLGHDRQELRDTSAGIRFFTRARAAQSKVVFRYTAKTPKTTWENAGTQARLLATIGNAAGSAVGVTHDAQVLSAADSDVNKTAYWDVMFRAYDDQDAADAVKPRIFRF